MGFMPNGVRPASSSGAGMGNEPGMKLVAGGGRDDGFAHYQVAPGQVLGKGSELRPDATPSKADRAVARDSMAWVDRNPNLIHQSAAIVTRPDGSMVYATGSAAMSGVPVSELRNASFKNGVYSVAGQDMTKAQYQEARKIAYAAERDIPRQYENWMAQGKFYGYI